MKVLKTVETRKLLCNKAGDVDIVTPHHIGFNNNVKPG